MRQLDFLGHDIAAFPPGDPAAFISSLSDAKKQLNQQVVDTIARQTAETPAAVRQLLIEEGINLVHTDAHTLRRLLERLQVMSDVRQAIRQLHGPKPN